MGIAPVRDHRAESNGEGETGTVSPFSQSISLASPTPDSRADIQDHRSLHAAVTTERRRAAIQAYRANIAEICNAADDEAALYQSVAAATADWLGAAAVAHGTDLRAFAVADPAGESAIAALFHVAAHRLVRGTSRIHYLREVSLMPPLGGVTAAAGYHSLAVVPLRGSGDPAGALLAAARGDTALDADVLVALGHVAAALDVAVTRVRQTARLREEMAALAAAMRRKDDFLAAVSHELRTPLTAILGFAHIIVENDALGAARRRGMAEDIVASGGLLLTQVNDLLDIVQLGAGRLSVPLDTVDVAAAAHWCARAMAPLMKSKGLRFDVSVAPVLPLARANKARLEQIVLNLLVNAYKFTPAGGTVSLTAERALERVTLSVADTGIGIAPEHLTRIFEPFERIETDANRTQSGAGVGLAVARRLVEMMHGTLAVESTPGVGSTFTVTVPVSGEE